MCKFTAYFLGLEDRKRVGPDRLFEVIALKYRDAPPSCNEVLIGLIDVGSESGWQLCLVLFFLRKLIHERLRSAPVYSWNVQLLLDIGLLNITVQAGEN